MIHKLNTLKGRGRNQHRQDIDNDINLLKQEFSNIFEDLKVKLYQDLDEKHKDYFNKYMVFKEKFQEYES